MKSPDELKPPLESWDGHAIAPGEACDTTLAVSESYSGMTVGIPIHIRRGLEPGPTLFVSAALHGNEINGTGAIRQLLTDESFKVDRGAVLFAPVLNILGFDRHSRYLPDRRDLNRAFPGTMRGSLASRMAHVLFDRIVSVCDYGIDLHTAAIRRTNYPNVRGDLSNEHVRNLATGFGCELIMNGRGPAGSLRREATKAGCPVIIMEGGEVSKVEPGITEAAVRGVMNVCRLLEMCEGENESPDHQLVLERSSWLRAERGGFLTFHVRPGGVVQKGQPVATTTSLLGRDPEVLTAPFDAVVIGMTTLPATSPGEPVCHLGRLPNTSPPEELRESRSADEGLETQLVEELATNVLVVTPELADPDDLVEPNDLADRAVSKTD